MLPNKGAFSDTRHTAMRLPLQTMLAYLRSRRYKNIVSLLQASWLCNDVVAIKRVFPLSCRQGYLKHFFDTGQQSHKNNTGKFLDIA